MNFTVLFFKRKSLTLCALAVLFVFVMFAAVNNSRVEKAVETGSDYIKWVDFSVTNEAMTKAYNYDVKTVSEKNHIDWVTLLALCGEKCGGSFKNLDLSYMDKCAALMKEGKTAEEICQNEKYYKYYKEAYDAVLGGFVGDFYTKKEGEDWCESYGLKAFSPIAAGYGFSHYKDFGSSRSYGFKRKHLGNDLLGSIGTPIICVESGTVEVMGWNRYGGWRVGIRSFDRKRYYYYAHLRKDFPFNTHLKEGDTVSAGEVIGYLGMTGYSSKENVNNINIPHLHFGMQIIFDEVQKDGNNEIWIDVYEITEFLKKNRSAVEKIDGEKNYRRKTMFYERLLTENGG